MNSNKNTEGSMIPAGPRLRENCQISVNPAVLATRYATDLIIDISGKEPQIRRGKNNEFYIPLREEEFLKTVPVL
ncbi:MAG TPA: hypothetical protein VFM18_12495, partial [Methanosarcina sp.]|nr:hypothetical protein [Methanosarcina sp.]